MNAVRKRFLAAMAAVAMLMALAFAGMLAPGIAFASGQTGAFTVTGGVYGTDYSYASNVLTIKSTTNIAIKNDNPNTATTDRIVVEKDKSANITLAGVNIDQSSTGGTSGAGNPALEIATSSSGNVNITLASGSTNILKGGYFAAGLAKGGESGVGKLTITGDGSLIANGGERGSGIGGTNPQNATHRSTANIEIAGGTVEANGGDRAAGIGGAENGSASGITISGGNVKVSGGAGAAGIGGGCSSVSSANKGSNITISGGTVSVAVHKGFALNGNTAIGKGANGGTAENIRVTGGSLKFSLENGLKAFGTDPTNGSDAVQLLEISNPNNSNVVIDNVQWTPANHKALDSSDTTLYAYLTKANHAIKIGDTQYNYTYKSGQFVPSGTISLTNPVTLRINSSTNYWEVSYDDGVTWELVRDSQRQPVSATGADGNTPQLRVSDEGYWQSSYDGTTWTDVKDASGNKVKATGDNGKDGVSIASITKTTEGLVDTYTITYNNGNTSTFTVTNGAAGKDGTDGKDGANGTDGKDGTTPQLRVSDEGYWQVSYDNGTTWTDVKDASGNKVKATGDKGDTGATGAPGKDGNTPQLKVDENDTLLVSYDNGKTWTSLGVTVLNSNTWLKIERFQITASSVTSLRATSTTGKKVKVSWKVPKGISGLKYQVKYLKKGSKKWVSKKTSKKTMTVAKLKKNAQYRFKVRGYKKVAGQMSYTDWETTSWVKVRK